LDARIEPGFLGEGFDAQGGTSTESLDERHTSDEKPAGLFEKQIPESSAPSSILHLSLLSLSPKSLERALKNPSIVHDRFPSPPNKVN
jgi:hypothetical protein